MAKAKGWVYNMFSCKSIVLCIRMGETDSVRENRKNAEMEEEKDPEIGKRVGW